MYLKDAAARILSGYDVAWTISGDAATRLVKLPSGILKREALRRIAQAARCSVWCDRENVVHFAPLDVAAAEHAKITANELYNFDGIYVDERIDEVRFEAYDTANDRSMTFVSGEGSYVKQVTNTSALSTNGQDVANWLLGAYKRRRKYRVKNRCDPAVEIGDTIKIVDAYGNNERVVVTGIEITYDGGLSAVTKGVGS